MCIEDVLTDVGQQANAPGAAVAQNSSARNALLSGKRGLLRRDRQDEKVISSALAHHHGID